MRRISKEAAACCRERREFAASHWQRFLETPQFLYPIADLPLC